MSAIEAERDLYRDLLDLAAIEEPRIFLDEVGQLLMRGSNATSVLIGIYRGDELVGRHADGMDSSRTSSVLEHISSGVLTRAVSTLCTVRTSSAVLDDRFSGNESVRRNAIEAVLCVPCELGPAEVAVVYLQRPAGAGAFSDDSVAMVERIVHRIGLVGRTALLTADDPTGPARGALQRCGLVGSSRALAGAMDLVVSLAAMPVDVLLTGASGTGKTMFARLLHDNSERCAAPFVHVNCPSVSESLFEAEFFGAKAGAYTGAVGSRDGFVQQAQGGTLFLDEVGDLSATAQAKLLQLLQERTFHRVGDPVTHHANVRVLAATHTDLDVAVKEGRFRADLRYRLEVLPLRIPSLFERRGDVPALVRDFAKRARERHSILAGIDLSPRAVAAAARADWPGNVRQLAHAVESALVRAHARRSSVAEATDLLPEGSEIGPATWQAATRNFQRGLLQRTLAETDGNVSEAARRLDVARSHLYEQIRALGVKR